MPTLNDLPPSEKQINFIWIGDSPINWLGLFNIATWSAAGWNVNIYKHQPTAGKVLWPDLVSFLFEGMPGLTIYSLADLVNSGGPSVMPNSKAVLAKWIAQMGVGYTRYAIGDLAKSFIAGTRLGVVLDLKIGPSKWIRKFPTGPLGNFVSFSRAGALDVENQCLGSLDPNLVQSNRYGTRFDSGVATKNLLGRKFDTQTAAEATFGDITGMHQMKFNLIRGVDLKKFEPESWSFLEILGLEDEPDPRNSGPFRVYQTPGYFNWKQGEYANERRANNLRVARTLRAEHGLGHVFEGFFDLDKGFYEAYIKPLALLAAEELER